MIKTTRGIYLRVFPRTKRGIYLKVFPYHTRFRGVTLVELLLVVAMMGLLASLATGGYMYAMDKADEATAITDIRQIELIIDRFRSDKHRHPDTLDETVAKDYLDPWSNPYEYTNLIDAPKNPSGKPMVPHRTDKWLNPLSTDYDLYSKGKDGLSVAPLTSKHSRDDIVRARNGAFVDRAEKF
jgi:general secretion pathway protein G